MSAKDISPLDREREDLEMKLADAIEAESNAAVELARARYQAQWLRRRLETLGKCPTCGPVDEEDKYAVGG